MFFAKKYIFCSISVYFQALQFLLPACALVVAWRPRDFPYKYNLHYSKAEGSRQSDVLTHAGMGSADSTAASFTEARLQLQSNGTMKLSLRDTSWDHLCKKQ